MNSARSSVDRPCTATARSTSATSAVFRATTAAAVRSAASRCCSTRVSRATMLRSRSGSSSEQSSSRVVDMIAGPEGPGRLGLGWCGSCCCSGGGGSCKCCCCGGADRRARRDGGCCGCKSGGPGCCRGCGWSRGGCVGGGGSSGGGSVSIDRTGGWDGCCRCGWPGGRGIGRSPFLRRSGPGRVREPISATASSGRGSMQYGLAGASSGSSSGCPLPAATTSKQPCNSALCC